MPTTRIRKSQLNPRKLPKQPRSEATVEAILEAAAQVFERHGYAPGTTNRIAERAGISIGSLYQYFPNKDAILVELVRRHLAEGTLALWPHIERLQSGEALERVLPDVVTAMVALHDHSPQLHRVLFEETPLPPLLRSELQSTERALVDVLASSLRSAEEVECRDPQLTARILLGAIEGLTHRLVLYPPEHATTGAVAAEITRLTRAYLRDLVEPTS
jgi:AcrR family transcriptional regulator